MDIVHHLQPLIHWLHNNPHWAGFATFIISLTESLAIVGYVVPGSVLLVAIGTLIGSGVLPLWSIFIWAILGAIAGDGISFQLGHYYKEHIREIWPFRNYLTFLTKGERFFEKHGNKSVVLGRFFGPVRPIIPVVAGMMNMSRQRFFVANVISGILWAPAYMLPGILVGAASLQLAPKTAARFIILVVALLLLIALSYWLIKRIISWAITTANKLLDRFWLFMKRHPSFHPLQSALRDPCHPENHHGQLSLALFFVITLGAFIAFSVNVAHQGAMTNWNVPIHMFMINLWQQRVASIMIAITAYGAKDVILVFSLSVIGWLAWKRQWRALLHFIVAFSCSVLAAIVIKELVNYPRPLGITGTKGSASYPSGHVVRVVGNYGFFAVMIARELQQKYRWLAYTGATVICLLVIFSRLYLNDHWLADVVGGTLLGVSIVMALTISYRRSDTSIAPIKSLLTIVLIGYLASISYYMLHNYDDQLARLRPLWPVHHTTFKQWWNQSNHDLPKMRDNRFGKPVQVFNLQWAGHRGVIKEKLSQLGWRSAPKRNIGGIINRLSAKNNNEYLPLTPTLYRGRKPDLVMYIKVPHKPIIAILRVWVSGIVFSDRALPLWYGTVNYQLKQQKKPWLFKLYQTPQSLPLLVTHLQQQLTQPIKGDKTPVTTMFRIKRIQYPLSLRPKDYDKQSWQGGVLLVSSE